MKVKINWIFWIWNLKFERIILIPFFFFFSIYILDLKYGFRFWCYWTRSSFTCWTIIESWGFFFFFFFFFWKFERKMKWNWTNIWLYYLARKYFQGINIRNSFKEIKRINPWKLWWTLWKVNSMKFDFFSFKKKTLSQKKWNLKII